jgi:hypothetical protein
MFKSLTFGGEPSLGKQDEEEGEEEQENNTNMVMEKRPPNKKLIHSGMFLTTC